MTDTSTDFRRQQRTERIDRALEALRAAEDQLEKAGARAALMQTRVAIGCALTERSPRRTNCSPDGKRGHPLAHARPRENWDEERGEH